MDHLDKLEQIVANGMIVPESDKNNNAAKGTTQKINSETNNQLSLIDWSRHTVIVAEDEDNNFDYLESILLKTKIKVLRAKDGKECVELVKTHPEVNVVLMDIRMPVLNGLEATRSIKSYRPGIIVVAQTAFAMDEDRRNCKAVGCDNFLAKPVRYRVLVDTLKEYFD
ncbi:MAG: response regulator [Bacteroidales bacterium]|nr:response regulator [Bacteroidales bacterium]